MLENDLYKFSMSYYYQRNYPKAWGAFIFHDRNKTEYTEEFVALLNEEFKKLNKLFLQNNEYEWVVRTIKYIPQYYWEWLRGFRYNSSDIKTWLDEEKHLHIEVSDLMYRATFYEIPILAIVSELYHKYIGDGLDTNPQLTEAMMDGLIEKSKIAENHNLFFADFGLRRRFSRISEDIVVNFMSKHCKTFVGTSNVALAMKYNVKPIGTMAHEIFQFFAAIHSPKDANFGVMWKWAETYNGELGTVLTDTFTVNEFLREFSMRMAKLYDGVRHDSGDPFVFGDKIIEKYKSYGIDPMSKVIVFSDGLNFEKAAEIKEYFAGKIKVSFGIGTNLTCPSMKNENGKEIKPCNLVMKLKECRIDDEHPIYGCVKLSDVATKAIGNPEDIKAYKYLLNIQ